MMNQEVSYIYPGSSDILHWNSGLGRYWVNNSQCWLSSFEMVLAIGISLCICFGQAGWCSMHKGWLLTYRLKQSIYPFIVSPHHFKQQSLQSTLIRNLLLRPLLSTFLATLWLTSYQISYVYQVTHLSIQKNF